MPCYTSPEKLWCSVTCLSRVTVAKCYQYPGIPGVTGPGYRIPVWNWTEISDDVKPQLALIAPHGAEILQIRKKLFVEHISQDLRSILSVMVSFQPFKWKIKTHFRNNLIQLTRISSSLKINTFNGRCIKDLWWQECSKFRNQAKLIYLHLTYSKL